MKIISIVKWGHKEGWDRLISIKKIIIEENLSWVLELEL